MEKSITFNTNYLIYIPKSCESTYTLQCTEYSHRMQRNPATECKEIQGWRPRKKYFLQKSRMVEQYCNLESTRLFQGRSSLNDVHFLPHWQQQWMAGPGKGIQKKKIVLYVNAGKVGGAGLAILKCVNISDR
jgi:hypothetical protein